MNKQKIVSACIFLIEERIKSLRANLSTLISDANNETKSSAGDKHETGRAMVQLEQEKLSKQLHEATRQKEELDKIDLSIKPDRITKGSIVETSNGTFFVSIALGKINFEGEEIFIISPQSPLGLKFMGRKKGETIDLNNISYRFLDVE